MTYNFRKARTKYPELKKYSHTLDASVCRGCLRDATSHLRQSNRSSYKFGLYLKKTYSNSSTERPKSIVRKYLKQFFVFGGLMFAKKIFTLSIYLCKHLWSIYLLGLVISIWASSIFEMYGIRKTSRLIRATRWNIILWSCSISSCRWVVKTMHK